jgi:cyanophycinase
MTVNGILIPIGGNEDKGLGKDETYTLDFIQDGILSHVVREAGGPRARILVIPTASSIPEQVGRNYTAAFGHLGCTDVQVLDIRKKEQTRDPAIIRAFQEAGLIMFSGGDQSRIARVIGKSELARILFSRFREEPLVIAGTSAGAMAMSTEMIAGGKSTEAMYKGGITMKKGLGLLPGLIIDSHFIQRGRFNRLPEALARYPHLLGVGLAEDTALIIREGVRARVIGSGMVIVFDPARLTHNNERVLAMGTPMSMTNLTVHILANGDHLHLEDRTVHVLPMDAPFE